MRLRDLLGNDAAIEPALAALEVAGLAVDSRAVKPGDLFFGADVEAKEARATGGGRELAEPGGHEGARGK